MKTYPLTILFITITALGLCACMDFNYIGAENQPCSTSGSCWEGFECCADDICRKSCSEDGDGADGDAADDDIADTDIWSDTIAKLVWQKQPAEDRMDWETAKNYCNSLKLGSYNNWRLPSISELRSLIRGCQGTVVGGSCNVNDNCLNNSCWSESDCKSCVFRDGLADGCYWPSEIQGDCSLYWSSSNREEGDGSTWLVGFDGGYVDFGHVVNLINVRCVRNTADSDIPDGDTDRNDEDGDFLDGDIPDGDIPDGDTDDDAISDCTGQRECFPGQMFSTSCGNCGTQTRTCTRSCQWGSYSSCEGEGVCSPDQTASCNNCGTKTCLSSCQWGSCFEPGFAIDSVVICSGTNFTGSCETFSATTLGCTFIGDDWANSIKLYINTGTCVVLRDDSCDDDIELQCGFKGNNCEQLFPNLSAFTPGYSNGNVWCSAEYDDNPNLGNTVNSIYWSRSSCVYE